MKIEVLTLFPLMFHPFLEESIVAKAIESNILKVRLFDIRDFADNKHGKVDDYPYGGGAGLIMAAPPIANALKFAEISSETTVIYFTPQGKVLNQQKVEELSQNENLVIICGHYKDIDQRIRDRYVTEEISIGDYVLSGGELPAMILIDAVARLQDGVLNDIDSAKTDSHSNEERYLGYPCYTRPPIFEGQKVPDVLLSGNHKKIDEWRKNKAFELTKRIRPDLLKNEK